jgi:hypothetical protein
VAFLVNVLGGLVPTFLFSRLFLWALKRWQGGLAYVEITRMAFWSKKVPTGGKEGVKARAAMLQQARESMEGSGPGRL